MNRTKTSTAAAAEEITHGKVFSSLGVLCSILAVLSFVLYANTLQNGYVLDDGMVLKNNTIVMKGVSSIPQIFFTPRAAGADILIRDDFYRPLSMAMFAAEVQLFGMRPAVGHFFNIVVFIGCVLMLFLFLDKFFGRKNTAVAFIAAFLFAIHPLHTEVVANIKSRDELLCYFFGFWALNFFMKFMKTGKIALLIAGICSFSLALLSKETVITFLVIIPVLFFLYDNENRRRAVLISTGAVLAAGVFLLLRYAVLNSYGANDPAVTPGFMENALVNAPDALSRIATEFFILGKYLGLMFIPYPLLCDYSYSSIPFMGFADIQVLLSVAFYGFLLFFSVFRLIKKKKDPWAFAVVFYLVTIVLFSNIPFFIGAEMGERFAFFASTGFCITIALALDRWLIKDVNNNIGILKSAKVMAVLASLLIVMGGMTVARNLDWKDDETLFNADVKKSPNDCRLYQWLGTEIATNKYNAEPDITKRQELDRQSIAYFTKALEVYPDFSDVAAQLGWIYQRSNNFDSAVYYDKLALGINSGNGNANNNMGSIYYSLGRYPQAAEFLEKAITIDPKLRSAYITVSNCYIQMKQYDKAIASCNRLLAFDPEYMEASLVLGDAYLHIQNYAAAKDYYKKVISVNPGNTNAVNGLGVAYLNSKDFPLAIEQFKRLISLSPGYARAYSNLGRCYFFMEQYDAAINVLNKAQTLDEKNGADFPILALCYQKKGEMDLASKYEEMAKQIYPSFKLP